MVIVSVRRLPQSRSVRPFDANSRRMRRRIPAQHIFENRHENAHGVVAEDGSLGDPRDVFVFRHGNRQSVILFDAHHHRKIGAAVADINDAVRADPVFLTQFLEDRHFSPARRMRG